MWDSIGDDYKNQIVSKYQEVHHETMSIVKFREFLALELYDNPFVKWRYVYEEEEGASYLNLDLVKKVNDALGFSAQNLFDKFTGSNSVKA